VTGFLASLARFGGVAAAALAAGWLATPGVLPPGRAVRLERFAWSWAIGAGLVALSVPLSFLAGLPPGWLPFLTLAALGAAGGRLLRVRPDGDPPPEAAPEGETVGPAGSGRAVVLLRAIDVVAVLVYLLRALTEPMWSNDFVAIWGLKGKAIYIAREVPRRLIEDPSLGFSHPEYPALSDLPGRDASRARRLAAPPRRFPGRGLDGGGAARLLRAALLGLPDRNGRDPAVAGAAPLRNRVRRRARRGTGRAAAAGDGVGADHRDQERGALLRGGRVWRGPPLRGAAALEGRARRAADGPSRSRSAPGVAGSAPAARFRLRLALAALVALGARVPEGRWMLALGGCALAAYLLLPVFGARGPGWLMETSLPRTAAGLAPLAAAAIAIRYRDTRGRNDRSAAAPA
jgi:hypothetical protein